MKLGMYLFLKHGGSVLLGPLRCRLRAFAALLAGSIRWIGAFLSSTSPGC